MVWVQQTQILQPISLVAPGQSQLLQYKMVIYHEVTIINPHVDSNFIYPKK